MKLGAIAVAGLVMSSLIVGGCTTINVLSGTGTGTDDALVTSIASKAADIAELVGGSNGYGGAMMGGYFDHVPDRMGFDSSADLATSNGTITVRLHNESTEDCEFHLSYIASPMGFDEQTRNVSVSAGDEVTVEIPCAEIVGLGSIEVPGDPGCHLADGDAVPNTMAVPGFLGLDYACGGMFEHFLTPDTDDLDGDGDTEELIITSTGMQLHMQNGGPLNHTHGSGPGMMGFHMGGM